MGAACCKAEPIDFDGEVELIHFELLRSVGKGAFGKVRIVQHKKTQKLYALKYINKAKCMKQRAVKNIIQERRLLEEVQCPFVCNMRFAFQDDEHMFMVLDLMLGGDLRFHLDRMGVFKEEMIRFYVVEIGLGLGYLHSKKIVHRDLKPDNVLMDEFGHCYLTDFNIAVRFREEKPLTATAGSMAYMAPEILSKKPYLCAIDWWSLGVMAFEFASGKRPFRGGTNEEVTRAITHCDIAYPSSLDQSTEMMKCIKSFLTINPAERLGAREKGDLEDVKKHPWLKSVDWEKALAKQCPVPFIPDQKKANFDATHELEELLLEENPLKAKPKKKTAQTGTDSSSVQSSKLERKGTVKDPKELEDLQLMEQKFTVFDYTKVSSRQPQASGMDIAQNTGKDGEDGIALKKSKSKGSQLDLAILKTSRSVRNLFIAPTAAASSDDRRPSHAFSDHMEGNESFIKNALTMDERDRRASSVCGPAQGPASPVTDDRRTSVAPSIVIVPPAELPSIVCVPPVESPVIVVFPPSPEPQRNSAGVNPFSDQVSRSAESEQGSGPAGDNHEEAAVEEKATENFAEGDAATSLAASDDPFASPVEGAAIPAGMDEKVISENVDARTQRT
ncbi:kinase-like domain-containing protein [Zopfochytrium polystomum]|nr:kinase-like domain-containing protein [Zopfochytrium polystomum]